MHCIRLEHGIWLISPLENLLSVVNKDGNIGFDGYIGTWILRIYRRYMDGYFYMNIDISKINKNTLKFMELLFKSVKMTLIIKYIH